MVPRVVADFMAFTRGAADDIGRLLRAQPQDEERRTRTGPAQHVENLDQRPAVLAARQTDHDPIAVLDQAEFRHRSGDLFRYSRF